MFRWVKQSLQRKLTIIMILSTIFPILILGIYSFHITIKGYNQTVSQTGNDILNQMEASLRFSLQDIERTSIFLIGLQEIQGYARSSTPTGEQEAAVLSILTNLVSSKDHIFDISIYTNNTTNVLTTSNLYSSNLGYFTSISDVTEKMWTPPYAVENYAGKQNILTFIRPLRSLNNYETLGWISISVNETELVEQMQDYKLDGESGEVYLLNSEQYIIASSEKSSLYMPISVNYPKLSNKLSLTDSVISFSEHQQKRVALHSPHFYMDWSILVLYSDRALTAESSSILRFTLITIVISIAVTCILIWFTARYVTNPIRLLTRLLNKINPDEPMPVYHSRSEDEIGQLAGSYSKLSKHIELLKQQVVRIEVRKKEADIQALQSQINPHFLYNTLSSVQWIALMDKNTRIADMIGALSDFLRFSLNKGNEFCKIEHEIEHVKNYVMIQNIRYPNKFEVDFIVSPDIQNKLMLKLLLQPLVENAMLHGIQKLEGQGNITICIEEKDSHIQFMVVDNGIGMNNTRLSYVEHVLQSSMNDQPLDEVYGLRNVNERLILHYGKHSALQIKSSPHSGTHIYFKTPIMGG